MTFQIVASLLPVGDIWTLFNPSSAIIDQPRHDGGVYSTSQPSVTLATAVDTTSLPVTTQYAPVCNSQLPESMPPLQQSIKSDSVGNNPRVPLLSAGLCSTKGFFYNSANHNCEDSSTH
jgi:hypothetical protein